MRHKYSIIIYDTKGDGWNNNSLTIIAGEEKLLDKISLSHDDFIDNINAKSYDFTVDSDHEVFTVLYNNTGF